MTKLLSCKRAFDFILAALGLIIFLSLFIFIPLIIYIKDGRPIFFFQERVGFMGKIFRVIKFRTMKQEARAHMDVDMLGEDPRVTKIGRSLRATAMDELPQLINILKGEMSFVGPKPLPYVIEDEEAISYKYLDRVPGYDTRISLRPGLTGISQIYAPKTITRRNKFRYDNLYVKNQSLSLDIKLIILSVIITLNAKWESSRWHS